MEMFALATRNKLRFNSSKGLVTTEDLWSLSLTELDKIAVILNRTIKESVEESFINKNNADEKLQLSFEIVKYVINTKLKEKEEKRIEVEKLQKKQQLLELINKKENESLEQLSLDELKEQLKSI